MKLRADDSTSVVKSSRPARGAWIEIMPFKFSQTPDWSRPARGAWIEICVKMQVVGKYRSRPARGAWIEMSLVARHRLLITVAPRKGCVD